MYLNRRPGDEPVGPDLDGYTDREALLRDARAFGLDLTDRHGRPRFDLTGSGYNASLARAMTPLRRPAPVPITTKLDPRQFWTAYEAVALANLLGLTMNTFLTVSWGSVGQEGPAAWRSHRRFMELMRSRMRDWSHPHACVWVRERGPTLGDHSHILMNLEPFRKLDLEQWANRAVRTVTGQESRRSKKGEDGDGINTVHLSVKRQTDVVAQWSLFRYCMKGLDPDDTDFALEGRHGRVVMGEMTRCVLIPQGTVTGKRSGVSSSLGPDVVRRAAEEGGLPSFWPRAQRHDRRPVYGDDYLRHGEVHRQLEALGC